MALITVLPPDAFAMGKRFVQWFAYNLLVAFFCALLLELASLGLAADDPHWTGILVHVTGIVTFLAYGGAYVVEGIWFSRTWPVVGKYLFDAAVYAALTAVIFLLLA